MICGKPVLTTKTNDRCTSSDIRQLVDGVSLSMKFEMCNYDSVLCRIMSEFLILCSSLFSLYSGCTAGMS